MTTSPISSPRRIIPRWRLYSITLQSEELSSPKIIPYELEHSSLYRKIQTWEREDDISSAIELVESALVYDEVQHGINAAHKLLLQEDSINPEVLLMANRLLIRATGNNQRIEPNPNITDNLYKYARETKGMLKINPNNPIAWTDLSYLYITLGQTEKAINSMKNALALANSNRFVIRSASRFFVHIDQADFADWILSRTETRFDPWLLAAEIAVSSVLGVKSRNIKLGKTLIESGRFTPLFISELASALATVELTDGNKQQAKKLTKLSLRDPTDNSLAQAVSILPDYVKDLRSRSTKVEGARTFEAKALDFTRIMDWEKAIVSTKDWLNDEPFSSRPAINGSYIAAVGLEDFSLSEEFARKGLISNPHDIFLTNNLAFALANQGKLEDARQEISNLRPFENEGVGEISSIATEGLIAFRSGDVELGIQRYGEAIEKAKKHHMVDTEAVASINFARESFQSKRFTRSQTREFVMIGVKRSSNPHVQFMLSKLEELLEYTPDQ